MATSDDDEGLKRLGGGRWATRDGRFSIEPQSGTWAVVDAEQTDELGLPLIRGPFGSLRDAKAAIADARSHGPADSPLQDRPARRRSSSADATGPERTAKRRARQLPPAARSDRASAARPKAPAPESVAAPPPPRWLAELAPDARRRARRRIERLVEAGAADAEGMVRRDVVGAVSAVAAFAVARALAAVGPDASPATVARLLADGRDDTLDVRWRLVDEAGRPIHLDLDDLDAH